ncbi:MAG: hypothetical protein ACREE3_08035 [Stellaceae bacterium]
MTGAVALTLLLLAGASYYRRFPGTVELPYWYLSYSSGFVRRGLLGTVVSPFIVGRSLAGSVEFVALVCTAMALAYLAALATLGAVLLAGLENPRWRMAWVAVAIFAVASPGLPMLAHDLGFLDLPIALVALISGVLAMRGARAAFVPALIGPLIHEAYFFLALPLLLAAWGAPKTRRLAMACAAVTIAMTAIVWFCSTENVTWQAGIPISSKNLSDFAHWQLGQGIVLSGWPRIPIRDWLATTIPVVAIWAVGAMTLRRGALVRLILGTLFSVSILVIAIDAERLLAWGCLTAPVLWGLEMWRDQSRQSDPSPNWPSYITGRPVILDDGDDNSGR